MILITSGAYIAQDFASEVGLLPPSFLPVGNRRLYEHQVSLLKQLKGDIYLSLPDTFELDTADTERLNSLGVNLLFVPSGLSLGQSILYSWNATGIVHDKLIILHGDTLFSDLCLDSDDAISMHSNSGFYQRAKVETDQFLANHFEDVWASEDENVVSGFFSFSEPQYLMQGIVKNNGKFIRALEHYTKQKAVKLISDGKWYDFGHLNSFFRSRSEMTTQRAFNDMSISTRVVEKVSSDSKKMIAEASWFEGLPSDLKIHTPKLLQHLENKSEGIAGYQLEYLYLLPLNDLFVFGNLTAGAWKQIFSAVKNILDDFKCYKSADLAIKNLDALYLPKTIHRLNQFSKLTGFDITCPLSLNQSNQKDISLLGIAQASACLITPASLNDVGISHGDLCFSNILYDSRVQCIKVIDPRGLDVDSNLTIYGDLRYDLAKIYHSIIGLYDFIIANHYKLTFDSKIRRYNFTIHSNQQHKNIEKIFKEMILNNCGFDEKVILAISVHLFLSMLPLHYDKPDRQQAMIANALRLYDRLMNLSATEEVSN